MTKPIRRISAHPFMSVSAAALIVNLAGCLNSSIDSASSHQGPTYVAIGNSLTAGFQSGGLRADWQKASYPALLAQQMGITDFQLPVIDSPGIGSSAGPTGLPNIPLFLDTNGSPTTKPLTVDPASLLSNRFLARPYNDLAVPGATTLDILNAYNDSSSQSTKNTYFNVVMRGGLLNNTSMLHQAINLDPDIITLWVGNNDILGGITAGTIVIGTTVTPTSIYAALMDKIIDSLLTKTHARIFMANIPSITSIPYVTTVPPFVFNPKTFQVDTTKPLLTQEANVKYVLLPALKALAVGTGIPVTSGGTGAALTADMTLSQTEVDDANGLIEGYNSYLKDKAAANPDRITLVDVNARLNDLTDGKVEGLTGKYYLLDPAHTAFSYDGIHPNSKGYRQIANTYLNAINATLGKSYPTLSP
jgi:lysophospholipase L1-like esterase